MSIAKLKLRPTTPDNLDFVLTQERHPDNASFVYQWSKQQHLAALDDPKFAHFILMAKSQLLGYLIFDDVNDSSRSINLRRLVVSHKGSGHGKAALELAKAEAFLHLNAHRLWLDVFTDNLRAYSLYKKSGFIQEGLLRESYLRNGSYASQYIMSILESEYLESHHQNE